MGLFFNSSPFDADIEKVTDEKNKSDDWGLIMDLCDRVQETPSGSKDCLRSIMKRLNHQDPHVVMQAITLLDACVSNCGKDFMLEVASRDFETEFRKLLSKSHPKIQDKLRLMLRKWAEGDFKSDSQYSLITGLYQSLKREGVDFSGGEQTKRQVLPKDPNVVSSQQEEEDIAKAIQLSLQENKSTPTSVSSHNSSLYPNTGTLNSLSTSVSKSQPVAKEQKRARALYDFEAAEDNELTFQTGEIVIILDDSDANWWKGSNHRGEGLFPANFVTLDVDNSFELQNSENTEKRRRSVQFNDEVEVVSEEVNEIDEGQIDKVLNMLHEADPTSPESDPIDLIQLEDRVNAMGPLIDAELEVVDRRHAELTKISTELVDALNLYHQLMREMPPAAAAAAVVPSHYSQQAYGPPMSGYMYTNPMQYGVVPPQSMPYVDPSAFASSAPPPTPPLSEAQMTNQPIPPQNYQNFPVNGEYGPAPPHPPSAQSNYPPPTSSYPTQQIM